MMIQGIVRTVALCLLLLSFAASQVLADDGGVAVQVPANKEVCFFEDLQGVGVKAFLHYTVVSGGSLDIEATILAPDGSSIWASEREAEGRVLFKSRSPGRHKICFSNKMSTFTGKVVAFSILVTNDGAPGKVQPSRDSLERSIARIQQGLREVQEVQRYLKVRERVHRATVETANTRVIIWSGLEILIIILMGVGSVWYLKRIFNKKRVI